ncbi:MAG: DUF4442 domain-containing protein [Gammaproteobacteria bacterium]|nr:DUF4442 domain-containing protein [Gammaproteobacteria bacterium]
MLAHANRMLWWFGWLKVPMIGYCRPRLTRLDASGVTMIIPLRRRTRNHLGSMYFGALAVGADVAGGFLAFFLAEQRKLKMSLAFKAVSGEFFKRPERDVEFRCDDGPLISTMLEQAQASGERINQPVAITARCPAQFGDEAVARFELVLSIKVVG